MISKALSLCTNHMPESSPKFGNIRSTETEYGYIVWPCIDLDSNSYLEEIEDWLVPIVKFAIENKCSIIEFDADNEEMPQFITYEW